MSLSEILINNEKLTKYYNFFELEDYVVTLRNMDNEKNTPSHLHYSIGTILPKWYKDNNNGLSFYTDPVKLLNKYFERNKVDSYQ